MSDDEQPHSAKPEDGGKSEAQIRMEQEQQRRKEKAAEEWAEYEEIRKVEREKEEQEIRELRERREKRKLERAEEEKRLAELRAIEDQKRRAEEDERQKKKREEETMKKEERERKRKEAEERSKQNNKPNYTINKRIPGADINPEGKTAEEVQKSKEQLESERRSAIDQRCKPLSVQGFNLQQLQEKARELHKEIQRLEGDKYDLQQRFEHQNYDMMELAEKARQMNKGGGKNTKSQSNAPDPLSAKISGIPPKIMMYSQYERVMDHRSFGERQTLYTGPQYKEEYIKIAPQQRVVMTDQGARVVEGELPAGGDENAAPPQAEENGQ